MTADVRGGMVPVNWHPPEPRFWGEIQRKAVRGHVGWYSHPTETGSGFMDEHERAAGVRCVSIWHKKRDINEKRGVFLGEHLTPPQPYLHARDGKQGS